VKFSSPAPKGGAGDENFDKESIMKSLFLALALVGVVTATLGAEDEFLPPRSTMAPRSAVNATLGADDGTPKGLGGQPGSAPVARSVGHATPGADDEPPKRQGGPVMFCRRQAVAKYEVDQTAISIVRFFQDRDGQYYVQGLASKSGEDPKRFQCIYNQRWEFVAIKKWTP
jgi:hypothetical protein